MAEFRVRVVVDPSQARRGSRVVEGELNRVGTAADRVGGLIRRAFAFVGVGVGVRELINLADTFTALQNRLRVVTNSTAELNDVTDQLFQIAQRTRSSFEGTVELYSRVALSARELGQSQETLLNFTESLNQALILSGATATEAQAGLIQFSQGLASGALRGDELRSVLEQLPVVADIIAQELGVTRGELRELGAEGAITADIIFRAFASAREELGQRFAKTVPTVSQSFQILRNAIIGVVGQFDAAVGPSRALSRAIVFLAENIDTVARLSGTLAGVLVGVLAARGINAAIVGVKALTAAIAANPIGAIAIGVTAAVSALIFFGDQIEIASDGIATLQDLALVTFDVIGGSVQAFVQFFLDNFGFIADLGTEVFGDLEFSVSGFVRGTARFLDGVINLFAGAFMAVVAIWENFPAALRDIFTRALNAALRLVEDRVNRLTGSVNGLFDALGLAQQIVPLTIGQFEETAAGGARQLGAAVLDALEEGFNLNLLQAGVEDIFQRAESRARERQQIERQTVQRRVAEARQAQNLAFQQILAQIERETQLLQLSNAERAVQVRILKVEQELKRSLTETERNLLESRLREAQAIQIQNNLLQQINGPLIEYQNTLQTLNQLLDQGRISQEQFNQALGQTQLATGLTGLRVELAGEEEGEVARLQEQLMMRNEIIRQAQEARLISEQEALQLSLEANRAYNDAIMQMEIARYQTQLQAGQSTFASLSQIAKAYAGEQSGIYRTLFAVSKAFAIADATVQIANALAKAANTPYPANLVAIATVAAQTARIVSTIQGAQFSGGFQTGGSFRVGGAGGADSQLVMFRATPNETVSVRTPGQERAARRDERPQQQAADGGGIRIVNVMDPGQLEDFLTSPAGERTLVNVMQRNQAQVAQIAGG